MRLIDADKLYAYLDDVEYPCDKYAEVEDILDIIKEQTEVNAIVIPDNATNGDVMMEVFKEIQYYNDGKICSSWWNDKYEEK